MVTVYEDSNSGYVSSHECSTNFFIQRVIRDWNHLPSDIMQVPCISAFENRL